VAPAAIAIVKRAGDISGPLDRAQLLRSLGVTAAVFGIPAAAEAAGPQGAGFVEPHPRWRFVLVNHATTNPFFVPTRYGIQDACRHYGTTYEWTGSTRSDVGEMVKAMRRAIDDRADGIAVSVIDRRAFNKPTAEALRRGIPVVSYNADGGLGNKRLAYVGQTSTSPA
jgi:simple sugar transport system substrate-binding protein